MKILLKSTALLSVTCVLVGVSGVPSQASPQLQIGILGGVYDVGTETIVTDADLFTVVALGRKSKTDVTRDHWLSIAVSPKQSETPGLDYGSFLLNGNQINVTADMVFGIPPIAAADNRSLGPHSVFDTYYFEEQFVFDSSDTVTDINTEDDPATPLDESGDDLYFVEFNLDISNLDSTIELHFDLYNIKEQNNSLVLDKFAPFSHDGGTTPSQAPPPEDPPGGIPEPTSLLVWAGLLGLIGSSRSRASTVVA